NCAANSIGTTPVLPSRRTISVVVGSGAVLLDMGDDFLSDLLLHGSRAGPQRLTLDRRRAASDRLPRGIASLGGGHGGEPDAVVAPPLEPAAELFGKFLLALQDLGQHGLEGVPVDRLGNEPSLADGAQRLGDVGRGVRLAGLLVD